MDTWLIVEIVVVSLGLIATAIIVAVDSRTFDRHVDEALRLVAEEEEEWEEDE